MWRIKTITGTIIESSRFTNKPMHWHERPVCNERRELWLATSLEDEHGFVLHTKLMPARKTHCVTLVLAGIKVLGLYNATTGTSANYVREDPPFLTRGLDILVTALLILCGLVGMALCHLNGWLVLTSLLAYGAFSVAYRAVARKRLRNTVDDVLNELQVRRVVRPIRSANMR
jgi:hypothetical protein